MKYRAVTMGIAEDGRPLQSFSDSLEVINKWAHDVAANYRLDVKIFQQYERALTIVKKPHKEVERIEGCFCGIRTYCPIHYQLGWQKGE